MIDNKTGLMIISKSLFSSDEKIEWASRYKILRFFENRARSILLSNERKDSMRNLLYTQNRDILADCYNDS